MAFFSAPQAMCAVVKFRVFIYGEIATL